MDGQTKFTNFIIGNFFNNKERYKNLFVNFRTFFKQIYTFPSDILLKSQGKFYLNIYHHINNIISKRYQSTYIRLEFFLNFR